MSPGVALIWNVPSLSAVTLSWFCRFLITANGRGALDIVPSVNVSYANTTPLKIRESVMAAAGMAVCFKGSTGVWDCTPKGDSNNKSRCAI